MAIPMTRVGPRRGLIDSPRGQVQRSSTAEIVCAERAAESLRPADRRWIDDRFAKYFLTKRSYRMLTRGRFMATRTLRVFDRLYPGYLAIVLLRNRWHESVLERALAEGVQQIVLLGAGYDTTALRLNLGTARVFEVDAPPTQLDKRTVIERHGLDDARVTYVPCDFETDSLPERLSAHGFDPNSPSLIAWWGVSFFLTEDAARQTVADVAALSAPGSRFMFDYLDTSVVDGTTTCRGALRARNAVIKRDEPYRFGLSLRGAEKFLSEYGFSVEHNLSVTQLAQAAWGTDDFPYSTDDFFGVITGRQGPR